MKVSTRENEHAVMNISEISCSIQLGYLSVLWLPG